MNKLEWILASGLIVLGLGCLFLSAISDPAHLPIISKPVLVPLCILLSLLFVKYLMARWMKK